MQFDVLLMMFDMFCFVFMFKFFFHHLLENRKTGVISGQFRICQCRVARPYLSFSTGPGRRRDA